MPPVEVEKNANSTTSNNLNDYMEEEKKMKTVTVEVFGYEKWLEPKDSDEDEIYDAISRFAEDGMIFTVGDKEYYPEDFSDADDFLTPEQDKKYKKVDAAAFFAESGAEEGWLYVNKAWTEIEIEMPEDEEFDPSKAALVLRDFIYPDDEERTVCAFLYDGKAYSCSPGDSSGVSGDQIWYADDDEYEDDDDEDDDDEDDDDEDQANIFSKKSYKNLGEPADLIIPEGVTTIGKRAFSGCTSLQSVTIPESVTDISYWAFEGCTSLQRVAIPKSVTKIKYGTFEGCSSLQSVIIPESVTEIGNSAFKGCSSLQSVTIPEGVSKIGDSAFEGCSSLQSVTIPENVTEINWGAFCGCTSLQSVIISEGVTKIGWVAFRGCTSLQSVTIPESVTEIGENAFEDCTSLRTVTLLNPKVKFINSAFKGCTGIITVNLPNDLTRDEVKTYFEDSPWGQTNP